MSGKVTVTLRLLRANSRGGWFRPALISMDAVALEPKTQPARVNASAAVSASIGASASAGSARRGRSRPPPVWQVAPHAVESSVTVSPESTDAVCDHRLRHAGGPPAS
jgi:hypothetical protein